MAVSSIVSVTVRSALLNATSNIMAQAITAYRNQKPLVVDWVPVFQFFIFNVLSTPPNFMWQDFLESTFPATKPNSAAVAQDEKARTHSAPPAAPAALSKRNTAAKFALDQTIGAAVNTLLFSLFMHGVRAAMVTGGGGGGGAAAAATGSWWGGQGRAFDYARVDWRAVEAKARAEFWPIMWAGWRFWPFVSAFNFVVVKSVAVRNLVGSLAGMAWGVYMSLVAAR